MCRNYIFIWLSMIYIGSQQTTPRDCTCSVSEFPSSTRSIHVFPYFNSPDSVNKFGVSTRVYREITSFSHDDTYVPCSETVPVPTQYDSCQTRSKLVTTGRTHVFTRIHMKSRTGGAVPIMNQYDTCQLVQKWFLVC